MGIPAVENNNKTAGALTKRLCKFLLMCCMGAAIFMLCAAVPASAAEAAEPFSQTIRTVTNVHKVPFGTTYIDLDGYYRGYEKPVSDGIMGETETRMQVLFEGERAVKVISIKTNELAKPIDRVVKRGVKEVRSRTADGSAWKSSFIKPVKTGWLSADLHDYKGHTGVDFAAPSGTPVYASAGGVVTLAGWYGEYGRCVMIKHADGSVTLYAHNSALEVSSGQTVKQGERIARMGSTGNSTGNHLHFEIRVGEKYLDPLIYIDK